MHNCKIIINFNKSLGIFSFIWLSSNELRSKPVCFPYYKCLPDFREPLFIFTVGCFKVTMREAHHLMVHTRRDALSRSLAILWELQIHWCRWHARTLAFLILSNHYTLWFNGDCKLGFEKLNSWISHIWI